MKFGIGVGKFVNKFAIKRLPTVQKFVSQNVNAIKDLSVMMKEIASHRKNVLRLLPVHQSGGSGQVGFNVLLRVVVLGHKLD